MKRGFALLIACLALAAGAMAAEPPPDGASGEPSPQAEGPPGPAPQDPPSEASPEGQQGPPEGPAQESPPEAPPGSSDQEAGAPAAESAPQDSEGDAPAGRSRVQIRSVSPLPVSEPVAEAVPVEPVSDEQADRGGRAAEPTSEKKRTQRATAAPAPVPVPAGVASSAAPDADPEPAGDKKSSDAGGSDESLPARVVPRPVREIVEVVPNEIWPILAALGLLAFGFAGWSAIAGVRARRLSRQRESLLQEVGLLQTALLPAVPDDLPVSVAYRPADGAGAGGDFYDAFTLPSGALGVILGDISGDGRDALARTTFVRYTLRAYLEAGLQPRSVVKVASDAVAPHLDGGFATVAVAVHDPENGRFTYACAGHAPPIVVGGDEPFEPVVACSAPPLGIGEATGFRQSTFTLAAGTRACLYTDGVIESRVGGEFLGAGRLERLLATLPPGADARALLDAVAAAADEAPHDMAVCLISAGAHVPASLGPRIEELEVDDQREVGDSLERFLRACGVPLAEVPGVLRQAGEAARREGSVTVRVRVNDFRPGVDVVPGNVVRLAEHRRALG